MMTRQVFRHARPTVSARLIRFLQIERSKTVSRPIEALRRVPRPVGPRLVRYLRIAREVG